MCINGILLYHLHYSVTCFFSMENFPFQYIQIYLTLLIDAYYLIIPLIWTFRLWESHIKVVHAPFMFLLIPIIKNSQKGQVWSYGLLAL